MTTYNNTADNIGVQYLSLIKLGTLLYACLQYDMGLKSKQSTRVDFMFVRKTAFKMKTVLTCEIE